jgi:hypothetical protein
MKLILTLVFSTLIAFSPLFCQTIETSFYKDFTFSEPVKEKKAKVKKVVTLTEDGISKVEIYDLQKACLRRVEYYLEGTPVNVWLSYDKNCKLDIKRDFSLISYQKPYPTEQLHYFAH